jgi:hypothetical protein
MSDHHHDHEGSDGSDDAPGYYELLEITVRELLIEKSADHRRGNPPPA